MAITSPVAVTQDTVLDLSGHDISAQLSSELFQVNGKKLTLKGTGTVSNKKWIANVSNGGELTINGGNYITGNEGFYARGNGSTIVFNGGHVSTVECAMNIAGDAILEMNGGTIETSDNMAIGTNGSSGRGGNVITMNGGKIDANITSPGYEAIGVYIANSDVFIMNNGEITAHGGTGLCMRAGDVTIAGGKITATGTKKDGTPVADGKIADSPVIMEGVSAVIYHESANYPAKEGMRLAVTGGVINGVDHSVQVLSNEETPNVVVSGGTLTPAYPEA